MIVSKRRVSVRIARSGNDPLDGFLALSGLPSGTDQAETILGLLNSSQRVIPFVVEGDGTIILLTRLNIDWVMAGDRVDRSWILPPSHHLTRDEPVELHFMNGTAMSGLMKIDAIDHCRASDFLNAEPDFIVVITHLGTLLVNKGRVREVRLITASTGLKGHGELDASSESAETDFQSRAANE